MAFKLSRLTKALNGKTKAISGNTISLEVLCGGFLTMPFQTVAVVTVALRFYTVLRQKTCERLMISLTYLNWEVRIRQTNECCEVKAKLLLLVSKLC